MRSIQRAHTTVILPAIRGKSSLIVPRSGKGSSAVYGVVVVVVFVVFVVVLVIIVSNSRVVIFTILVECTAEDASGIILVVVDDATAGSE